MDQQKRIDHLSQFIKWSWGHIDSTDLPTSTNKQTLPWTKPTDDYHQSGTPPSFILFYFHLFAPNLVISPISELSLSTLLVTSYNLSTFKTPNKTYIGYMLQPLKHQIKPIGYMLQPLKHQIKPI